MFWGSGLGHAHLCSGPKDCQDHGSCVSGQALYVHVEGLGFRVEGLGFRVQLGLRDEDLEFTTSGCGCRVSGSKPTSMLAQPNLFRLLCCSFMLAKFWHF